ncbi:helix-turn-helix domain-containing protein [Leptospira sp. B5-022]|uniref:AlbA family DNA-binding domain-containing protein n=1 Tax=Leptospira sp. B5-022 TaxID=1242992 RepID=UPI0012F653F2|nr:ATP-binding protein [Leptospira sp. B5-022]
MQRYQILDQNKELLIENLISASEGWFIEYKEKFNDSSKASKSITSFLNSYGGYIVVGVKEIKEDSIPKYQFIGIDIELAKRQISLIKDTIKRNISPTPYVDILPIPGPIPEIGLEKGKQLIVIDVPAGNNPPYISLSGKIYRRKHDSSEGEEENSRYVVDELYAKSKEIEFLIQKEIDALNYIDKRNDYKLTNLNVYYFPSPFPNKLSKEIILLSDLDDIIDDFGKKFYKFDNVYTEGPNIVFRSVLKNDYRNSGVIALFNRNNYSFKVRIQSSETYFPKFNSDSLLISFRANYKFFDEFIHCLENERFQSLALVGFTDVLKSVVYSFCLYKRILDHVNYKAPLCSKIILSNAHGKIPFMDYKLFIEHCKKYKMPYFISDNSEYPILNNITSFIPIDLEEKSSSEQKFEEYSEQEFAILTTIPITVKILGLIGMDFPEGDREAIKMLI